jgi:class 3 adenylate cyclase
LGTWGTGADLDLVAPTVAADDNFRRWYAQVQRMSASPATAVAMARQWYEVDVRSVLPAIRVPTLVLAHAANVIFPVQHFHQLVQRQLERYQGRLVDTAGDGALTLFDSPARAIVCAEAVRDGVRALGMQVRAGVHTGEMEHGPGGEIRGIAVHTGTRVAALAGPGEIYVSRTIRDLVAGAPIRLESRGVHQLKGVPGSWEVFAVAS